MTQDLSCRLIFLASPGGLSEERAACREIISKYHASRSLAAGATFFVHAWEDVSGGVGRPQDLINPNLDECDYMILLLGDKWGSPPGTGQFTSGTEEEFFRAVDLLADAAKPMRDILILFKAIEDNRLRDPGSELKPVLDFRAKLQASKSLMYESFDSVETLENAVNRKLEQWCKPLCEKNPVDVTLPADDQRILPESNMTVDQLIDSAQKFAASGQHIQAEAAYANAISDGDPKAILDYAKFMRRTGRPVKARELNQSIIENRELLRSDLGSSIRYRASALANIGVIQRNGGDLRGSIESLREAVETARSTREAAHDALCYSLDNYGLTLVRAGLKEKGLQVMTESHDIRNEFGSHAERAQSAINLGRGHINESRYDEARELFDEAVGMLDLVEEGHEKDHLQANALCGLAEAKLRSGEVDGVAEQLSSAIELNEKLRHSDGLSIAHSLMARYLFLTHKLDEAAGHIRQAQDECEKSGNSTGRGVVAWLQAELSRLKGDVDAVRTPLELAREEANRSHNSTLLTDIEQTDQLLSLDA